MLKQTLQLWESFFHCGTKKKDYLILSGIILCNLGLEIAKQHDNEMRIIGNLILKHFW